MVHPALVYPIDLAGGDAFDFFREKPAIELVSFDIFRGLFFNVS